METSLFPPPISRKPRSYPASHGLWHRVYGDENRLASDCQKLPTMLQRHDKQESAAAHPHGGHQWASVNALVVIDTPTAIVQLEHLASPGHSKVCFIGGPADRSAFRN